MKNLSKLLLTMSCMVILAGCIAIGAATIGAVTYYKSAKHEVASVNIKATPDKIYQVALDSIEANPSLVIITSAPKDHFIEIIQGELDASLKVSTLSPGISQLLITSDVNEQGTTEIVLKGVFKICESLKANCVMADEKR